MVYMVSNPAKSKYFTGGVRIAPDSTPMEKPMSKLITSETLHACFDSNGHLKAPSQQVPMKDNPMHTHPDFYSNLPENHIKRGNEPEDMSKSTTRRWRLEKEFDKDELPVHCIGFESTVKLLKDCGWIVTLEYNRFTGTSKLAFCHKESGLMGRVAYQASNEYVQLPMLYAVKNYKMRAAKFTETVHELGEDNIPELLEWIREVKRPKISEIIWDEHKEKARNKVVELAAYFKERIARKEAA